MQSLSWINRWKQRHTFKLEMALVVSLKALLLCGIWYFFFSTPLQDHLDDQKMTAHFMGSEQHPRQN
jgi:hypothetical protein